MHPTIPMKYTAVVCDPSTRENSGVAQYPISRAPVPFHDGIGEWVVDGIEDVSEGAAGAGLEVYTTRLTEDEGCVEEGVVVVVTVFWTTLLGGTTVMILIVGV
jgi:hypothetical protein